MSVQELEAERDGARLVARQMQERLGAAQEQLAALEAEVTRLRGYVQHKPDCERNPNWQRERFGGYREKVVGSDLKPQIREYREHVCGLQGFGVVGDTCLGCTTAPILREPVCTCGLERS